MLKKFSLIVLSILTVITLGAGTAEAAKQTAAKPVAAPTGNDISYPQCGRTLLTTQAFGIVGVNGGKATTTNSCMSTQLNWAAKSSGQATGQPKVQVYVNTGNPGEVLAQYSVTTWPTNNQYTRSGVSYSTAAEVDGVPNPKPATVNPYGNCTGSFNGTDYSTLVNDLPCSWQYGWNRAVEAVDQRFGPAVTSSSLSDKNPTNYTWWLDVETMNSWQGETDTVDSPARNQKYARNAASLEGMAAFYKHLGAKVGIYSTSYQWGKIVGTQVQSGSNLNNNDNWLAGAANLADAKTRCSNPALTAGGKVTLVQYISKNLDYDYSCL